MKRKSNNLFHLSLLLTFIILFSVSLVIQRSITMMNNSVELFGYQTENNERRIINSQLASYATSVENDVQLNHDNKNIPSYIFRKYMFEFYDRKTISNISVINVGYTFDDKGEDVIIDQICNNFPSQYHTAISNILKNMISELTSAQSDSNKNINSILDSVTDSIVKLTGTNKQIVENIFFKELFVTNKIIMSTNNSNDNKSLSDDQLYELLSNDSEWNEWVAIPKGYLGVNNESSIDNGKPNLEYNKYIILVTLNRDAIMKDYDNMKAKINQVSIILLGVLAVISILALSLCLIHFYKKINGGDNIEPIIRTSSNDTDDAVYKLFHRINRKSK